MKEFGVSLASERKLRKEAKSILGDNLMAEEAPFSFSLKSGGEEIRMAPLVCVPNLIDRIICQLNEHEEYVEYTRIQYTYLHTYTYIHSYTYIHTHTNTHDIP